jgi:alkylglycerol monooxygenase
MEQYGTILTYAMPIFLVLCFIERAFEWKMGAAVIRPLDSISSFSSGMTNVVKDVLGLGVSIISYKWLVGHIAIFQIEAIWLTYLVGYIAIDFQGYWSHRWSHGINFLWNRHIIHHSSEEFNLSCALRQTISSFVSYFTFLLIPAALLGVPAKVMAVIGPLHLFMQFWYHTRLIGKLGWLEHIIVTPSHHRVHHAINPEYLDKNHGQIFIFWDKWFGTFQEELPDVPPVFGVTRPVRTWNPIKINFQHIWLLFMDAVRAKDWKDKFRVWFMPTGWRPADVEARFPVEKIDNPYNFEKYDTNPSRALTVWSWVQVYMTLGLVMYFFSHIGKIPPTDILLYGAYVFVSVYAYTELMDKNPQAWLYELVKSAFGLSLIYRSGDWFKANQFIGEWATYAIGIYFIVSVLASAWFVFYDFKRETKQEGLRLA